ncbi:membrane-associated kinase regulator 5 [Ricinus communis]|uniref:membrane-associated kinase regulator 5 n=1 Tax=Ricinus communis TaxID=3988 RepID=UPI00201B29FA|nr:membrane-associated kinase regulator 5 [Ricinus communis]
MEALYFLKFWRPTTHNNSSNKDHQPRPSSGGNSDTTEIATSVVDTTTDDDYEFDEEEDSFFELELTVPDLDNNNKCKTKHNTLSIDSTDSNRFDSKDQSLRSLPNIAGNSEHKFPPPTVSLSPTTTDNHLLPSKRKILPIEPISKQPQSPISLLKSAPRFRVLMFKKSRSMAAHETEFLDTATNSNKKQESKLFTVKFKLKEVASVPIFTRDNSLRKQISDDSLSDQESSKRFSKEVIQKYLKLIKPLYIKVSKKQTEKPRFSGESLSVASPSSSPATVLCSSPKKEKQGTIPAGIRVVCKHLGKSKSESASTVAPPSTVSRRDDSLLLQHDGIQSAILHCKKSFNSSSRDSSLLSRFASDPLHERLVASPRISYEEKGIRI